MNLYEESQFKNNSKSQDKKVIITIVVLLVVLLFVAIGIIFAINYLKKQELKLYIDGAKSNFSEKMFKKSLTY